MICRRRVTETKTDCIEIVPAKNTTGKNEIEKSFEKKQIKMCVLNKEKDFYRYEIDLPDTFVLKPPDLREFAYEHDIVNEMIKAYIKDNVEMYMMDLITQELFDKIRKTLHLALSDLSSIMDLISVDCESGNEPGSYRVSVIYEYKNGERNVLCTEMHN
jgi:hypothetical protein